jgi:hypothetical protein
MDLGSKTEQPPAKSQRTESPEEEDDELDDSPQASPSPAVSRKPATRWKPVVKKTGLKKVTDGDDITAATIDKEKSMSPKYYLI